MKEKRISKPLAIFTAVAVLLTAILACCVFSYTRTSASAETATSEALDLYELSYSGNDGNIVQANYPNGYVNVKRTDSTDTSKWSYHDTAVSLEDIDYTNASKIWIEMKLNEGAYDTATSGVSYGHVAIVALDDEGDQGWFRTGGAYDTNSTTIFASSTLGGSATDGVWEKNEYTRLFTNQTKFYVYDLSKTVYNSGWADYYVNNSPSESASNGAFDKSKLDAIVFRPDAGGQGKFDLNIGAIYAEMSDGSFERIFTPADASVATDKNDWNANANRIIENPNIQANSAAVNTWYSHSINKGGYYHYYEPTSDKWSGWWDRWAIPTDISAYNGVSYYVDNTLGTAPLYLILFTQSTVNSTKNHNFFQNGNAWFYPDSDCTVATEPYYAKVTNVQAGFKGRIVVPFSATNNLLTTTNTDERLGINMLVKATDYTATSFVLRDVKLVKDAKVQYSVTATVQKADGTYQSVTYVKDGIAGQNHAKNYSEISSKISGMAEESAYTYSLVSATSTQSGKVSGWGNINGELSVTEKYEVTAFVNNPFALPATLNLGTPTTTSASQVGISGDSFTVTKSSSSAWTGVSFSGFPTNLTRYNGISYYIDLSNNTQDIFFNKYFTEGTTGTRVDGTENFNEVWYSNYGAAMYYPDEGTDFYQKYGAEYSGHINRVPAGFKGTIVVPFVGFNNDWSQVDKIFDLTNIKTVALTFERSVGGGTFTLNDFKLVSDAKLYIGGNAYIQKRDGDYGESKAISSLSGTRESVLAGSAWRPAAEIEIGGVKFVIDESKSTYDPLDDNSYGTDANWKKNVIVGTENRTDEFKNWGMGNATWRYNPTVYYKYKDAFEVEKVFGLDDIKTSFKKGTTTEQILSQFPEGAVTVGNSHGGFTQILGEWSATEISAGQVRVSFVPSVGAFAVLDPDGLLTYDITVSQLDPVISKITVSSPLKTAYAKGESLELGGLTVTAIYDDGTIKTLTTDDFTVSGYDKDTLGEQTITVTYESHTATFKVRVVDAVVEDEPESGSNGATVADKGGCSASTVAQVASVLGAILALFVIKRRV